MIDASSDIVVATEITPPPPEYNVSGQIKVTSLPDVVNGVKWKVVIQHVLKGDLEVGEQVDVFLPITYYIGNHPVEFPMASANS